MWCKNVRSFPWQYFVVHIVKGCWICPRKQPPLIYIIATSVMIISKIESNWYWLINSKQDTKPEKKKRHHRQQSQCAIRLMCLFLKNLIQQHIKPNPKSKGKIMADKCFCSLEMRVKVCRMKTNLCCLHCQSVADCLALCRANNHKILPCVADDIDDGEECGFLV